MPAPPPRPIQTRSHLSRRRFLTLGLVASAGMIAGCDRIERELSAGPFSTGPDGRLASRPGSASPTPAEASLAPGRQEILVQAGRRVLLSLPRGLDPSRPSPLSVGFHGASGRAEAGMRVFGELGQRGGVIEVSPEAAHGAWDVMLGGFGEDAELVERTLAWVFSRFAVDPRHIAAVGFSNGASYALSLGLTNGDLFTHIVSFSPGFMAPADRVGRPPIFIAHGTEDRALPIDRTSRTIVPALRRDGYDVTYREFEGRHEILPSLSRRALDWFLA
jgi:phospholipase/carboxylesterase